MKGRKVPDLNLIEAERRRALAALDIPALRTRMTADGLGLTADDALVLQAAHETRAVDLTMPRALRDESIAWLKEHHPDCATLATIARYPSEFRRRGRTP